VAVDTNERREMGRRECGDGGVVQAPPIGASVDPLGVIAAPLCFSRIGHGGRSGRSLTKPDAVSLWHK
jgi:hypothetical protein